MATQMGIRELRDTLPATIRRVQRGETIEVTHHGSAVAVLAPVPADRIDRLLATGDVSGGDGLDRPLRRSPVTGEVSASEALAADRSDD